MSDLAKRAVACKDWRWLPGMLTQCGERLHMWNGTLCTTEVTVETGPWGEYGGYSFDAFVPTFELPDFDDEATCHLMLPMARKAWGALAAGTLCEGRLDTWTFYVRTNPWADELEFIATTEVGAIVAALEAAPKQP